MNMFLKIGILAFILFNLVGCTKLNLAIRWADTYALSEITDYFDLDSIQKEHARQEFKQALKDVKKIDFPAISKHILDFSKLVEASQASPEKIEKFLLGIEPLVRKSVARFEPLAQKIVTEQADKGFAKFDENFEKKYKKDQSELNDKKIQSVMEKRLAFWLKETIDKLTPEQEKYLNQQMATHPMPLALQLANRKFVYLQFNKVRNNPETRRVFLHRVFADWDAIQLPEFTLARTEFQKLAIGWMVEIFKTSNEKQKRHMIDSLKKRASEFQKLSQE